MLRGARITSRILARSGTFSQRPVTTKFNRTSFLSSRYYSTEIPSDTTQQLASTPITEVPAATQSNPSLLEYIQYAGEQSTPLISAAEAYDQLPWYQIGVKFLYNVHHFTGLPWWCSIIASAVIVRLITIPANYYITKNQTASMLCAPQLAHVRKRYSKMLQSPYTSEQEKEKVKLGMRAKMQEVMKQNGASLFGGLIPAFVQLPFLVYLFYSVRYMCSDPVWGIQEASFGWIHDLSLPDPWLIIPAVSSLSFLINFEIPRMLAKKHGLSFSRLQMVINPIFRTFIMGVTLLTMKFPVAIHMYFFGTGIMNILTALAWRSTTVQKTLNLPGIAGLVFSIEHSDPEVVRKLLEGSPSFSRGTASTKSK